ncbi:hypothetical protein [Mesorhizobium sp. B2-7-3]|uniref:hypothetical protein n=1 Tax=Mesorhizobium sp. B2-7-3 TaxID=2589907 RepID=UPI0015E478AF|nr:hypothetical protein [Mesorhizobium sp. B2-7-3]
MDEKERDFCHPDRFLENHSSYSSGNRLKKEKPFGVFLPFHRAVFPSEGYDLLFWPGRFAPGHFSFRPACCRCGADPAEFNIRRRLQSLEEERIS